MSQLLVAGGVMAALGIVLSGVLAFADRKFYVREDPRIEEVEKMLPGANCGACGFAGCRDFAEKVVEGKASPAQCTANNPERTEAIAAYLGVDAGTSKKQVARLACAGGNNVSKTRVVYRGLSTCRAATLISGGSKGCSWGCLGYGDCAMVCPFDAITMDKHDLPIVNEAKCTACGDCVRACPKDLFSIHPITHNLWVACKNLAAAKEARAVCEVACIGCGLCEKDAKPGVIEVVDKLAKVDYSKNDAASINAIQRCPTGAIVWYDGVKGIAKGEKAKPIERTMSLPIG